MQGDDETMTNDLFNLKNKTVLITGVNNPCGIGAAIAQAFAKQGCKIFLHGYRGPAIKSKDVPKDPGADLYQHYNSLPLDTVLEKIRSYGVAVDGVEGDLSDPKVITALFDKAKQKFGTVQILINNAATSAPRNDGAAVTDTDDTILASSQKSFERPFFVNTRSTLLAMAEFSKRFIAAKQKDGNIVNISTDGAHSPYPGDVSYGASKLAIESYSKSAAHELAKFGIRVNIVSPGPVQSAWINKDFEKTLEPMIPLGRIGVPEEVADAVIFMACKMSRWITGQRLWVNGGLRM
jgi:3-oxoacyl-[acyl-carrier protein] reductase